MSSSHPSSSFSVFHYLLFLALFSVYQLPCAQSNWAELCELPFRCGNLTAGFPFWGEDRRERCGHPKLKLHCEEETKETILEIDKVRYIVLRMHDDNRSLTIARKDYFDADTLCLPHIFDKILPHIFDTILDPQLFRYLPPYKNYSILYRCVFPALSAGNFTCYGDSYGFISPSYNNLFKKCETKIHVPVIEDDPMKGGLQNETALLGAIKYGFRVEILTDHLSCINCNKSGGTCGFSEFMQGCYCKDHPLNLTKTCLRPAQRAEAPTDENRGKKNDKRTIIGVSAGAALFVVFSLVAVLLLAYRRRRQKHAMRATSKDSPPSNDPSTKETSMTLLRSISALPSSTSNLHKSSTFFGTKVFSYAELEAATRNFSTELGDGGFGTVYYGVLRDGRAVAVKHLYENNLRRAQQFANEVEILARLDHPNLVTLYGCTSRHSRELLLVYEYVPNGTVADHLHGELQSRSSKALLRWDLRLNVALETASALAYLHASDVIHRDVKTNNILLDSNFHVKVADFGLSRLFPTHATHVSTAPQGTPGYMDPEYYQCYQLTEKSDVYSFGVVLIELISAKEAVDVTRHRYDINLASMALNRIQNGTLHELVDPEIGFEDDERVRRAVMAVAELAFRCLQQERDVRPSMEEVVEILREIRDRHAVGSGKAEVLDISAEDAGLLKNAPPPLSPPSTDNYTSGSTTNSSF